MKYYIVCDYREKFNSQLDCFSNTTYNDHPKKENIDEIVESILSLGYDCEYFGGIPELIHAIDEKKKYKNSCFINFTDGMQQRYSRTQAPLLLDILNVPFSGSDVFATAIMNNKHYCKLLLKEYGIETSRSVLVNKGESLHTESFEGWSFPLFAKPNLEGSSIGISSENVCQTYDSLLYMVHKLQSIYSEVIVEEFVSGVDVTDYIIGNGTYIYINDVIISKLDDSSPFAVYGAQEKMNKQRTLFYGTEYLDQEIVKYIQSISIKISNIIGVNDICRIDYRYDLNQNKLSFIEINSSPRFSSSTEIGFIANKRGITFSEIVRYYLKTINRRISHEHRQ